MLLPYLMNLMKLLIKLLISKPRPEQNSHLLSSPLQYPAKHPVDFLFTKTLVSYFLFLTSYTKEPNKLLLLILLLGFIPSCP